MRIACISDIHGNLVALKAVLHDIQHQDVAGIIVAGDFTSGPQPQETTDLLRAVSDWIIRGNSEDYCVTYERGESPSGWCANEQWAAMRWSHSQLTPDTVRWLASLPAQRTISFDTADPVRVVHGSPRSTTEQLFPDRNPEVLRLYADAGLLPKGMTPIPLDVVLAQVSEPVLLCGHSHIPWVQRQDGQLIVNAGSVGAPNNKDPRAQYALLSWRAGRWEVTHRFVPYDLAQVRAVYEESGYLAGGGAFARACLLGIECGQNVPGALISHVYTVAAAYGVARRDSVPDAIWKRATSTFRWHDNK